MKKITGKFEKNNNFINIYCNNTMYTVARNTGDWSCIKVGERIATGHILTQEIYDKLVSECTEVGTFELSE